ncbi:hypothetical protein PybrP1_012516 [[Pythium] brassicae (nom. inval.)]|nr:hypothetical protein PybrP1_012516 [[Pythium] brassicae (nom. inval.)]
MALKSYHKETLNDNWYEERAPPLNRVLPNDGAKEYATTTGSDFSGSRSTPQRQVHRMISDHNLEQAMRQTASTAPRDFRSAIPQPDLESQRRHLDSTHRTSYVSHFASSASPNRHGAAALTLVAAGGVAGRNVERGKAASGAMGEVFRVSTEPQKDTQAQRSWTYSTDPMIAVMRQRATHAANLSLVATESPAAKPEHFRRQSTSITTIPLSHNGVFADD